MEKATNTYSSLSSAKRGAARANLVNATFDKLDNGRYAIVMPSAAAQVAAPSLETASAELATKVAKAKAPKAEKAPKGPKAPRNTVSAIESPVAKFREIFEANFGTLGRSEIIKLAVEAGVGKNTATSFYQRLKAAKKEA
jgi:hypothetical protein